MISSAASRCVGKSLQVGLQLLPLRKTHLRDHLNSSIRWNVAMYRIFTSFVTELTPFDSKYLFILGWALRLLC